jgi:hypothetical protein
MANLVFNANLAAEALIHFTVEVMNLTPLSEANAQR